MSPMTPRTGFTLLCALMTIAVVAAERDLGTPVTNDGPGLSLRIPNEAAPAGAVVQIKVEVTEPKPISTGRGKIKTKGVQSVQGIVLMNRDQDTYGLALVDGEDLTFAITSPSSLFGTPADYPLLGIAGTVAAAAPGASFPLTLDPSGLGFRDPSGAVYPNEIQNGNLTVANDVVAIGNVSPGSAIVPAGGVVTISGANFTPSTRLQLHEVAIREQRFISSSRIDIVLAETANMHGMRIRARNEDGNTRSESEYFSYQRAAALGTSNDAIFGKVVPLFAPATYTTATVGMPARSSRRRRAVRPAVGSMTPPATLGLALQNLQSASATVSVELLDASGNAYAINTVSVGPDRYLVRGIEELFGIVDPPSAIRIRSTVPVQVLGLTGDPATGSAAALAPG